ncbi:Na/Pi cotransporter family protein, partial [bacterium]
FRIERIINSMEREIAGYLVKLSNTALSEEQHFVVNGLFTTSHDIERVGDHADNLAELALYRFENKLSFSESAEGELRMLHERVLKSYREALLALHTGDVQVARRVVEREGEIDHVQKTLRTSHIARMNRQQCSPGSGVIFLDILTNLERIGDHASKIAFAVLDVKELA